VTAFLTTADGLALTKAFMMLIKKEKLKRSIVDLVEEMADGAR
jgi:hypothetical protein